MNGTRFDKGKLIVMEGACDGIGKTTQYTKLYSFLEYLGYEVVHHHFPSYNTPQGAPVEEYLAGKFGKVEDLNPYFINSLYANDRACTWYKDLKQEYDAGKILLLDRYTTSTFIYQAATIEDMEERKKFIDYVSDYEYNQLGIAKPDMVIFLTAPYDLVTELRNKRTSNEGQTNDIHESNSDFMRKVYDNALFVADYLNFDIVECSNESGMKDIDDIHREIYSKVKKKLKQVN